MLSNDWRRKLTFCTHLKIYFRKSFCLSVHQFVPFTIFTVLKFSLYSSRIFKLTSAASEVVRGQKICINWFWKFITSLTILRFNIQVIETVRGHDLRSDLWGHPRPSEAIRGQKIVLEAVRGCGLNPTSEVVWGCLSFFKTLWLRL